MDTIPWARLETAYGPGTGVPAILRKLASPDRPTADEGFEDVYDDGLVHQLTNYTATVAAVPFIVSIAAQVGAHRRPRLIALLSDVSVGRDVPYSPEGTTAAVRQAIRGRLWQLVPLAAAPDPSFQFAMAGLAAALPFDLASVRPMVRRLLGKEKALSTRTALAGAMAVLGDQSSDVMERLLRAEKESVYRAVRRGETWSVPWELTVGRDVPGAEDVVGLPVHSSVASWARRAAHGVEDEVFLEAARNVNELFTRDPAYYEVVGKAL